MKIVQIERIIDAGTFSQTVSAFTSASSFIHEILRFVRAKIFILEPFDDDFTAFQIHPDPMAAESLADIIGRPAAAKGIEDQIAFAGGHQNDSFQDFCGQLVQGPFSALELPVPDGSDIIPHIRQRDPVRIHRPPVTAVVLDLASAVTAGLDGGADSAEGVGLPFGEIKQAVMGRIEPAGNRQGEFDVDRNPVTKRHPAFRQMSAQKDVPFRQVVNKQGAARFQNSHALVEPFPAPGYVIFFRTAIINPAPIFLRQIEGRIGKDGIDDAILNTGKDFETIGFIQGAVTT